MSVIVIMIMIGALVFYFWPRRLLTPDEKAKALGRINKLILFPPGTKEFNECEDLLWMVVSKSKDSK